MRILSSVFSISITQSDFADLGIWETKTTRRYRIDFRKMVPAQMRAGEELSGALF